MTSSNITASSTKAEIIQSAEEMIGDLDERLTLESHLSTNLREERNFIAYLLLATTIYSLLF